MGLPSVCTSSERTCKFQTFPQSLQQRVGAVGREGTTLGSRPSRRWKRHLLWLSLTSSDYECGSPELRIGAVASCW